MFRKIGTTMVNLYDTVTINTVLAWQILRGTAVVVTPVYRDVYGLWLIQGWTETKISRRALIPSRDTVHNVLMIILPWVAVAMVALCTHTYGYGLAWTWHGPTLVHTALNGGITFRMPFTTGFGWEFYGTPGFFHSNG